MGLGPLSILSLFHLCGRHSSVLRLQATGVYRLANCSREVKVHVKSGSLKCTKRSVVLAVGGQ